MAKLYFVEYTEARRDLLVRSSPTFVMLTSFDVGVNWSRNCGYRRKQDAVKRAADINAAAGKPIARYAGARDV